MYTELYAPRKVHYLIFLISYIFLYTLSMDLAVDKVLLSEPILITLDLDPSCQGPNHT